MTSKYRSAVTGNYVPEEFALANPNTTVRETETETVRSPETGVEPYTLDTITAAALALDDADRIVLLGLLQDSLPEYGFGRGSGDDPYRTISDRRGAVRHD